MRRPPDAVVENSQCVHFWDCENHEASQICWYDKDEHIIGSTQDRQSMDLMYTDVTR